VFGNRAKLSCVPGVVPVGGAYAHVYLHTTAAHTKGISILSVVVGVDIKYDIVRFVIHFIAFGESVHALGFWAIKHRTYVKSKVVVHGAHFGVICSWNTSNGLYGSKVCRHFALLPRCLIKYTIYRNFFGNSIDMNGFTLLRKRAYITVVKKNNV
jgi:hypothetical protein